MTESITVDMPVGLNRALARWCAENEATMSEAVAHAVRSMLQSDEDDDADYEVPARGNGFLHQLLS
jgi:hypothetical protein